MQSKQSASHLSAGIRHAAASTGGDSSGGPGLGPGDASGCVDQAGSAQLPECCGVSVPT